MRRIVIILILCLYTTNCVGSMLTIMSPLQSTLVTEKSTKSPSGFHYVCELGRNRIYLTRTLYCPESAETFRIARKRGEWAHPVVIVEMMLYGLGFIDILGMHAISENSKVEYLLGNYDTGVSIPCGEAEVASGESMVIRNDNSGVYEMVITDNAGSIDLISVLGNAREQMEYRICLASEPAVSFSFVY